MLPKTCPKTSIRLESEPTELSHTTLRESRVTKVTVSLSEKEEKQGIKVA